MRELATAEQLEACFVGRATRYFGGITLLLLLLSTIRFSASGEETHCTHRCMLVRDRLS